MASSWRSVSTTSIAIISSSSGCRLCSDATAIACLGPRSLRGLQAVAFGGQLRQAALAVLDRDTDLLGVLCRHLAHLVDDLTRVDLEVDNGIHQLLDRSSLDGRAIAGLQRRLLNAVADLG